MRHGKKFNHLSRKSEHRKAMLANMAVSLIKHKRINTTLAKAKALRQYVEPLITKSKEDTTHSRRVVFSYLQDKEAVSELFREISPKIADRPGGYTRILKTGNRVGDNAEMCIIELVDYNENMLKDTKEKKTKTRRRRGGSKKNTDSNITTAESQKVEDASEVKSVDDTESVENVAEITTEEIKEKATSEDEKEDVKEEAKEEVKETKEVIKAEKKDDIVENKKEEEKPKEKEDKDDEVEKPEDK
ncbi:MAG: hypothetical protein Kow0068_15380 [Marinilabiliales bacterium]